MSLSTKPIGILNTSRVLKNKSKYVLPIVPVPIVAYINPPPIRTKDRNKLITNEQSHLAQPVTKRTEYNTKQLKDAGVKDSDVEKYLKSDGHVTDDGKKILREKNKSFKGASNEGYENGQPYYCFNEENYEVEMGEFKDSLPDMRLSPQLDNVYKNPSFHSARELMQSILGEDLLNKLEADLDEAWDCMSNIKHMTLEILGFGE